jgi:hypothetical protein
MQTEELMSAEEEERLDKKRVMMWAGPATVLYINFIRDRHLLWRPYYVF